ncbi:Multifunctional non-homologous end joining protein LigD [Achromobacter aegrifaciens]|uniref:DNA ligase D n=1 Tax=Achromobacter aegrifaciens TaxID=1287736 RepID=UPI001467DCBC|nr:DNA ligase D [Achromobacter aegrifaciens]CAB3813931.1 Multifunctional non-homologous end joining protein LigD [Achromobacter aegrifaciens]
MADSLKKYREKRNFAVTPEPAEGGESGGADLVFVIQKHWASRLHYDFRLELDGAMKSWAVPKGPSFDPSVKRMAVQVEDHPIAYNQFEGTIPEGQYGAGKVIIWDEGRWTPIGDPRKGYKTGHLKFTLDGVKLRGRWALIRMKGKESDRQPPWLLIKENDEYARPDRDFSVVDEMPDSVVPLRTKKKKAARSKPQARAVNATESTAALPGKAAPLPVSLKPQLATLVDGVPRGADDWSYEMKFDGYRILARLDGGSAKLYTRNGHDWTARIPRLAQELAALEIANAWIDGEIVVLTREGVPSFQALQNAFDAASTADIVFYAFDLPYVAGRDLRDEPLRLRRDLLRQVIARCKGQHVKFSEAFDKPPADLVASACKLGLEGIIGKRLSAPYVSRRTDDWIKLKCTKRQEFVIVGYTEPKGSRQGFGALLLAVHEPDGGLRYAGNVGTGFDDRTLLDLHRKLAGIEQETSALTQGKPRALKQVHWVHPTLVGEVSFGEWTGDGHVRHSTFRGLRTDKPPKKITREVAMPAEKISTRERPAKALKEGAATPPKGMKLSNPDRVIDPSSGATKLDLARYYGLVAPLMMPHLRGRPVSFVRAPAGIQGQHFFQRHSESPIAGVLALPERLYPEHPPLMEISNEAAILAAAQLNVVEFHTWNAIKTSIAKPDRMLFDLDPGEGVDWPAVQQGAELVRVLLQELGLRGWLKTSGGKGLHVVVPIRKQYGWDAVKDFSEAMVRHLAQTLPKLFVAKSGPKNRVGKIFADYLRNGFGATTVAAWSARARPGLGVSVPVRWDELDGLKGSAQWTIANIHTRLDAGNEAWDDYAPQAIGRAMKQLGIEPKS